MKSPTYAMVTCMEVNGGKALTAFPPFTSLLLFGADGFAGYQQAFQWHEDCFQLPGALRRILYGLYAIIKLHPAKEEEIYLPLLEARLYLEEADHLVEATESTAAEAKDSLQMTDRHR